MSDIHTFVMACYSNNIDAVRQLINKVDVNGLRGGYTGLIVAMCSNYQDIVRMLLDHPNIELDRTDSYWKMTGLHWSCYHNHIQCVRLFLAHDKSVRDKSLLCDSITKT